MAVLRRGRREGGAERVFATRHVIVRTGNGYRSVTVGSGRQILGLLAVYFGVAGLGFCGVGYAAGQQQLAERAVEVEALRRVAEDGRRSREAAEARLRQIISELEHIDGRQRDTIDTLGELRATLERELEVTREELAAVGEQRDAARQVAARERDAALKLAAALDGAGAASVSAEGDGGAVTLPMPAVAAATESPGTVALAERLTSLESELLAAAGERDRLRRSERGLRWRVEVLETRLAEMRRNAGAEADRVRDWIVSQVSALEGVLAASGVDVDRLLRRVDTGLSSGQGGPLEPVPPAAAATAGGERAAAGGGRFAALLLEPALKAEMSRLRAVHALLQAMPLTAPMRAPYRQTSGYGVRRDPITGRAAMHSGLDFGGASGARVLATAPGRVVEAGRLGAYGVVVEVDHGMGIRTRYGHLRQALVKVGDEVGLHAPVGIMGSTGRSTGEHLHYEVRVDGVAYDPADFLEAGRHLGHVLKG